MTTSAPPSHGLEVALLGLLRTHPRHAYELHLVLQRTETLGIVWHLKQGHLYALLAKLEDAGYVESTLEPHGARPPRKVLRLTARGREAFGEWVTSPVEHGRDFRLEFLAKLSFAAQDGEEAVRTLITRQRVACHAWVADLDRQIQAVSPERRFERLVVQFRASQLDAILTWLDTCEQTLALRVSS
jgi:PadR family transcriptional regulator, regulatory protein AphA